MKCWCIRLCLVAAVVGSLPSIVVAVERIPQIVLNEVELNPPGRDAGKEWIEILNVSDETIDLAGWTLTCTYRSIGALPISEGALALGPGERYVFTYPSLMLRNAEETVIELRDPSGQVIDATSPFRDEANDGRTWQRYPDGGDPLYPGLWLFGDSTKGRPNE